MTEQFEADGLQGLATRHCAVAFADLVESERITGIDEKTAIARWRSFKREVRERLFCAGQGRVVREVGDGLLLEFANARDAVAGGFALHEAVGRTNGSRPAEECMALRIGVHVGEVMFDDQDVYGRVPTAAHRVMTLAQPGETLVSSAARDQLVDGVHANLEDMGPRHAKHGVEPIRIFRASPVQAGASARRAQLVRPADLRPTLAVVPFTCLPADPEYDALGHALADDIIAAMARHPGLRVVSRLSTSALRDACTDWSRMQQLLGATYVLSGRCYPMGERMRVNLELTDVAAGEVVWADTARSDIQALFDGNDELIPHVVAQVAHCIVAHELIRVRSLPMASLRSYTLFLGAEGLMHSLERRGFQRAHEVLEHLAERHPRQAAPHAMLARWHVNRIVQNWSCPDDHDEQLGQEHAARALEIDTEHPTAMAAMGLAQMNLVGDVEAAKGWFQRVLDAHPHDAQTWAYMSGALSLCNEHDSACAAADRALQLSPLDPGRYLLEAYAAMSNIAAGRYEAAVEHARQSVRLHMLHAPSHLLLVGSLWLAGQRDSARDATRRFLQACPGAAAGKRTAAGLGDRAGWREHLGDAVRSAGVPALPH